nr:FKBP-type peptidyl-prolyl cis-trans isomerase [uncultured Thiothrix sp.]
MNKKLSLTIATLLSVGALLAACGDKAATTNTSTTTATETKAAEPAATSTTATPTEAAKPAEAPATEAAKSADPATTAVSPEPAAAAAPAAGSSTITSLQSNDVKAGTGAEAVAGKTVSVHYTGWLYDEKAADKHGTKFDSSYDRDEPFEFSLGGGQVIQGWDQGVAGMKVGGQRTLTIPASLAYGETGAGGGLIPPNATLVFDVELLDVK